MPDKLIFDPEKHAYTRNGQVVPSVTGILKSAGLIEFPGVSRRDLDIACDFGKKVHMACELHDNNTLDPESIDPQIMPFLEAWKSFVRGLDVKFTGIEQRVYSAKYSYAGTVDRIGYDSKNMLLLDIKTCPVHLSHAPQTAAYLQACMEMDLTTRGCRRMTVHLQPYTYSVRIHDSKADSSVFLHALQIWKYKHK